MCRSGEFCNAIPVLLRLPINIIHSATPLSGLAGKPSGRDINRPAAPPANKWLRPRSARPREIQNRYVIPDVKKLPNDDPQDHPETSPDQTDQDGLVKELATDIPLPPPDGLDQADLLGPLRYGHQHNIHQRDRGPDQRDQPDRNSAQSDFTPRFRMSISTALSLLSIIKLSSSVMASRRIGRRIPSA